MITFRWLGVLSHCMVSNMMMMMKMVSFSPQTGTCPEGFFCPEGTGEKHTFPCPIGFYRKCKLDKCFYVLTFFGFIWNDHAFGVQSVNRVVIQNSLGPLQGSIVCN